MEKQEHNPRPFVGLLVLVVGAGAAMEFVARHPLATMSPLIRRTLGDVWSRIINTRAFLLSNAIWIIPLTLLAVALLIIAYRTLLQVWHNVIVAKIAGVNLKTPVHVFDKKPFSLIEQLNKTEPGKYFIGMTPQNQPVYLSELDLCTHIHLMGQTGSGKTASVITPLLYQCLSRPNAKGVVFIDAKGSGENVAMMQDLATRAERHDQLRVFALAYPEWSHTYNPVWPCIDADATAERVFSVFNMENEYYRGQAWLMFRSLVRLLASTGMPFNLLDIRTALVDDEARLNVYERAKDARAQYEIESQLQQLGKKRLETFTGLYNALADYDHPLLNSYSPSIILEDLVNRREICYFNLPANRYPILAPAIGKIVLQHLQGIGSMRQIDRTKWDQHPFLICIDELNRFAFPNLVPALCMLRDAKMQFVLSHQSLGDLQQVSPEFSVQVKDNTRCKIYLYENDAEHLEMISRSFGTRTTFKRTVRFSVGPLLTFLNSGEVSNREVEEFVLHPNALKALQPRGQGYVLVANNAFPVNLELLPSSSSTVPDPRRLVKNHQQIDGLNLFASMLDRNMLRRSE